MENGEEYWAETGTPPAHQWTLLQETGCFPPEFEQLEGASGRGDLPAVEEILKSNWPGGIPGDEETSRLLRFSVLQAIDHDHHHVAAYLLSHGVSVEMEYARRAVEKKSYALMEILLTHGWDINTQLGPDDPAAIVLAFDDRRMIERFLSHGADPNAECELGLTPLSVAVEIAPFDIVQLLFDHAGSVKRGELLHLAACRNLPDCATILQFLLERGAEINRVKYCDNEYCFQWYAPFGLGTPLHDAAATGNEPAVRYLLDQGANPLIRDTRGALPSEVARNTQHETTAQLLESAAAAAAAAAATTTNST